MTIVSTQEFNANQPKYFDMAVNSEVCIRNNQYLVRLICQPIDIVDEQMILQPDDDLHRAITLTELFDGAREHIKTIFKK